MLQACATIGSDDAQSPREGADLDGLPWRATLHPLTGEVLTLALQEGTATPEGLVITHAQLEVVDAGDQIRRDLSDAHHALLRLHIDPFRQGYELEQQERDRRRRRGVAERLDRHRTEMLSRPLNPDLSDHWSALGGSVPRTG